MKRIATLLIAVSSLLATGCQSGIDGCYEVNGTLTGPDGSVMTVSGPLSVSKEGTQVNSGCPGLDAGQGGSMGAGGTGQGGSTAGAGGAAQGGQGGSTAGAGGVAQGGHGGSTAGAGGVAQGGQGGAAAEACGGPYTTKHASAGVRISASAPAYATPDFTYPNTYPSDANDDLVSTRWRSWDPNDPQNPDHRFEYISPTKPVWLAYDLSSVPAEDRGEVVALWDLGSPEYDTKIFGRGGGQYNGIKDYSIDVNSGASGSVPASGWSTLLSVTGNTYHSRQHVVDLNGATWVRLFVTKANGSEYNWDATANFVIEAGCSDSWIMLGDSITAKWMQLNAEPSLAGLIYQQTAGDYYPLMENGGISGSAAHDWLVSQPEYGPSPLIDYILAQFPGKYVCLSFGTNGLGLQQSQIDGVYADIQALVAKIYAAGKRPCVSYVPWSSDSTLQYAAPILNSMLATMFANDPELIEGPQFWDIMNGHTEWYEDALHPNDAGRVVMRQAWAASLLSEVYY